MVSSRLPKGFIAGLILLALLSMLIAGAKLWTPHDPLEQNADQRLEKPSAAHPFGTDRFGRDVLARTLYGGQTTLIASLTAIAAVVFIGMIVGLIAGLFSGSILDRLLMRWMDVLMAFPFMVVAMVVAALFGTGLLHLLFAVVSVWWVSFARLTRSIVLHTKTDPAFAAAQVLGASRLVLIVRELLPKSAGPVFVLATFELGSLILSISALSFLGLGAQPPTPEWGSMLSDGKDHFMQAPHILLGPTCFITLTVLSFNLLGEGLRDRLDPYECQIGRG